MNTLVTGGASGLGSAITKKMASEEEGRVYFTYYQSANEAKAMEKTFSNTKGIQCDFRKPDDIERLLTKMPAMNLDVLVHNATLGLTEKHFHDIGPDIFLDHFVNGMMPTIRITQTAIRIFRKKKFGKIISILSSAIIDNPPIGMSEYAALKSYLLSLSKSWATENARFNITANCISPSFMQTDLTSYKDPRIVGEYIKSHPLKKLLTPEEVAESVFFLGHCSQHINGVHLVMNAGETLL